ncbi:MAG: glycosyltransferase family 4 protein [Planctomycetaceae bacterium]|nr:glycosyltransferase family 4 protein [Planctomycetaceae bacterium]
MQSGSDRTEKPFAPETATDETASAKPKLSKTSKANESLHVLLLSDRFEVRGTSSQTLVLAEYLPDYGIHSTIVTPSINCIAPERRSHLEFREYSYLDFPFARRATLECIKHDFSDPKPDLIHIQSRKMLWHGIKLAKKLNRPYVLTVHDYLSPGEILNYDTEFGYKIIAVSVSVKSELLTQPNITGEMVKVIHSGVEYIPDDHIRPVLASNCTPVIGTAGPLEEIKGGLFFLQAARKVLNVLPDLEFLVAGTGPEERRLRQLARSLGIEKQVTFVSSLYSFQESLRAMDIFCLPSLQQGLGTIMLEAMACSRPVIASSVGGIASTIVDGDTGLLIPPSNSDAIAEKLIFLLQNPDLARNIGEAGKKHVRKNFRVDQTVRRVADLYRSCNTKFSQ